MQSELNIHACEIGDGANVFSPLFRDLAVPDEHAQFAQQFPCADRPAARTCVFGLFLDQVAESARRNCSRR